MGLVLGYNIFLFLLYVMIPVLVRKSSATLVNLSFLTSDVYSVLFGIFLFHAHVGVMPCYRQYVKYPFLALSKPSIQS